MSEESVDQAPPAPEVQAEEQQVSAVQEKPEQDESATEESSAPEEQDDESKALPRGVQKRLNELTRAKHEANRRAERLEAMVERLVSNMGGNEQPQQHQIDPLTPPNPEDFPAGQYDPEYMKMLMDHRLEVRLEQENRARREYSERQAALERGNTLKSKEEQYRAEHPGYDDAREAVLLEPAVATHPGISHAVLHSDKPAELIHWLGSNMDQAREIALLSPFDAAMRLGRIEAMLSKEEKARPVSSAPAPAKIVRGNGGVAKVFKSSVEASNAGDFSAFVKLRDQEEKARRTSY